MGPPRRRKPSSINAGANTEVALDADVQPILELAARMREFHERAIEAKDEPERRLYADLALREFATAAGKIVGWAVDYHLPQPQSGHSVEKHRAAAAILLRGLAALVPGFWDLGVALESLNDGYGPPFLRRSPRPTSRDRMRSDQPWDHWKWRHYLSLIGYELGRHGGTVDAAARNVLGEDGAVIAGRWARKLGVTVPKKGTTQKSRLDLAARMPVNYSMHPPIDVQNSIELAFFRGCLDALPEGSAVEMPGFVDTRLTNGVSKSRR